MSDIMYDRIIIKVGTSTLTHDTGRFNLQRMEKLACVISDIKNRGVEVVLVSSGAISAGKAKINSTIKSATLEQKQAFAAIGQSELMRMYDRFFSGYGHQVAQILLSKSVFESDEPRKNAKNTFNTLFGMDVIPIVNENDSISYDGVRFESNDTLAAYVALICESDLLINLTDMDGLYDKNPRENDEAMLLKRVKCVDEHILSMASGTGTSRGTGGMVTKLESAKMVTEAGIAMVIANGKNPDVLYDIVEGKGSGTFFCPKEN